MRALVLDRPRTPLRVAEVPKPEPGDGQVLVRVRACGLCRPYLHVVDGELPRPKLPLIPGHQVVGKVVAIGSAVDAPAVGGRVGVPWLGWTCGSCDSAAAVGRISATGPGSPARSICTQLDVPYEP